MPSCLAWNLTSVCYFQSILSPICWHPLCFPKSFNNSRNFITTLSIIRNDMEEELFGQAVIEQYTSFNWDTFAFNFDDKPLLLVSVEWGNECVLQVVLKLTLHCRLSIISCLSMTKVFVSLGRKMDRWSLIIQWFIIFYRVLLGNLGTVLKKQHMMLFVANMLV